MNYTLNVAPTGTLPGGVMTSWVRVVNGACQDFVNADTTPPGDVIGVDRLNCNDTRNMTAIGCGYSTLGWIDAGLIKQTMRDIMCAGSPVPADCTFANLTGGTIGNQWFYDNDTFMNAQGCFTNDARQLMWMQPRQNIQVRVTLTCSKTE
jgi:hypothetical protein